MEWTKLVEANLLSSRAVDGVAVLTRTGSCVYTQGLLHKHQQQDWTPFCGVFSETSASAEGKSVPKLSLEFDRTVMFVVFKKTQCSMYGTSAGGMHSLVVCSFPVGVLVCVSQAPTLLSKTVTSVENFAALLRQ